MGLFKKDSPRGFYTRTVRYKYRGFFGICPVYISDTNIDEPHIRPRHWAFEPLFLLTELLILICTLIFDFYLLITLQPERTMFLPLYVTGNLDFVKEFEEMP